MHRFLPRIPLKTRVKPQRQSLELYCEKGVLRNFANFTGKYLCWSLFLIELQVFRTALKSLFNRVAGLSDCKFIKKRLQHRYFPVGYTRFLRTPNSKSANDYYFWNLFFHLGRTALFNNLYFRLKLVRSLLFLCDYLQFRLPILPSLLLILQ